MIGELTAAQFEFWKQISTFFQEFNGLLNQRNCAFTDIGHFNKLQGRQCCLCNQIITDIVQQMNITK